MCRGCGETTTKKNRRVLYSDASSGVLHVWQEILEKTLCQLRKYGRDSAWKDEEHTSYLCRRCYGSLEKYKNLQASLVSNMEKALSVAEPVPTRKHSRMEELDQERDDHQAKRPRLDHSACAPTSRASKQLVFESTTALPGSSGCRSPAVTVWACSCTVSS